jgi:hypothetical protein
MALVVSTFERKSIPIVAWYILSKESYMKRVMSDVLPTVNATIAKFSGQLARLAAVPRNYRLTTLFTQKDQPMR